MSETRRNKGVDALVPDEATPEMLVELLPKAQGILKASASYLALVRRAMDSKTKQEHLQRWGDIDPILKWSTTPPVWPSGPWMRAWPSRPCSPNLSNRVKWSCSPTCVAAWKESTSNER